MHVRFQSLQANRVQYFCVRTFKWVSLKPEFDADFESVEKVAIISYKKVIIYFYYHAQKFSAYNF